MKPGAEFGVVGKSGSGKSTIARLVMALDPADRRRRCGWTGAPLFALSRPSCGPFARISRWCFRIPYGSLDPRLPIGCIVAEPLAASVGRRAAERRARVAGSLAAVGSRPSARRYPHEFSGGQRQRIAIARALVTRPKLVVADEPVSALDVSVQAQALNLMCDLQRDSGVTFSLISHDLGVVGACLRDDRGDLSRTYRRDRPDRSAAR